MKSVVYTNTILTIGVILLALIAIKNPMSPAPVVKAQATARHQFKFETVDRNSQGLFDEAAINKTLDTATAGGWQLVAVFGSNQDIRSRVSNTVRNDVVYVNGGGTVFLGFVFQK